MEPEQLEDRICARYGDIWRVINLGESVRSVVVEEPLRDLERRLVFERLEYPPILGVIRRCHIVIMPGAAGIVLSSHVDDVATRVVRVVAAVIRERRRVVVVAAQASGIIGKGGVSEAR